jgi:hypothetical protein
LQETGLYYPRDEIVLPWSLPDLKPSPYLLVSSPPSPVLLESYYCFLLRCVPLGKTVAMATTTDAARVEPLAEQEEEPKKAEPAAAAAEEEEEHKKVEAGGDGEGKDEKVRLEGESGGFGSLEAENGEAEAGRGGPDAGEVEAAEGDGKSESLGAAAAEKEVRELAAEVAEAAASAVGETPATCAKSVNDELGARNASPASPDASAGEEEGELKEEKNKPGEGGVVAGVKDEGKVADDTEWAVPVEEKPEGTKGEEMGSGDGGGGELSVGKEEEEVSASAPVMKAAEPDDKVAPAAEANGKFVDEVEASDDMAGVGGEEALEETFEKKVHVEDEAAKPETLDEESPEVSEHAGSDCFCY